MPPTPVIVTAIFTTEKAIISGGVASPVLFLKVYAFVAFAALVLAGVTEAVCILAVLIIIIVQPIRPVVLLPNTRSTVVVITPSRGRIRAGAVIIVVVVYGSTWLSV